MPRDPKKDAPGTSGDKENQDLVVVVGAGRMGLSIARTLTQNQRYSVHLVDPVGERADNAKKSGFTVHEVSGTDQDAMERLLKGARAVAVAAPDSVAAPVAKAARESGCHYVDISESRKATQDIAIIAKNAAESFVPQCGLAPGYVSSLVSEMIRTSGPDANVRVYVGVLPAQKTNRLGYGNMWGIDGLITEYTTPCHAILAGKKLTLPPLSEYETLNINGIPFEAFTTSGSVDDLVQRAEGKVNSLVFKTLRYPGHLDYLNFLIEDLRLVDRPYLLKNLLLNGLPMVEHDQIIISVVSTSANHRAGKGKQDKRAYLQLIHAQQHEDGTFSSAVSIATAAHVCSVIDVLCSGLAPHGGLLHHGELEPPLLGKSQFYEVLLGDRLHR